MAKTRRIIVALAGVVIGHNIVHAIHHDHANQAAHGYVPVVSAIVIPAGIIALVSLVQLGLRTGSPSIRPLEIATMQVYLFATQELIESMSTGASLLLFLTDPIMWAGIAVQVAVAWLIVAVLGAIRWMMVMWLRRPLGHIGRDQPSRHRTVDWRLSSPLQTTKLRVRGPPVPVHA